MSDIRVVEFGSGPATAWAGRLLADHGADVIKVEPPEGDPLRKRGPFRGDDGAETGGYFQALNLNKLSVCAEGEDLQQLMASADIIIHDLAPGDAAPYGLDAASVDTGTARVVLSITPFGATGPHAGYVAEELNVANAGGWASLCPTTSRDPEIAPLKVFGDQCALMSGIAGAAVALATLREVRRSGTAEFIDLSQQDYVASVLEGAIPSYSYSGQLTLRYHERSLIPWRIFDARDGAVFLVCVEQDQWERLVDLMGNPDWAALPMFDNTEGRAENQDLVHNFVAEFIARWDALDFFHAAQARRICCAPVLNFDQLAEDPHIAERGFLTNVAEDGVTTRFLAPAVVGRQGRAEIRRGAPAPGEHTAQVLGEAQRPVVAGSRRGSGQMQLPLEGVRVLDMTWAWAGPFGAMNLAHLGADVVRLESETRPDLYRRLPFFPPDMEPGLNRSGMFNQWSQGKRSVSVNLRDPAGIEVVRDAVRSSDVLIQNFATGVMDRLGIGYDALAAINPGIILASISGYGQTGPYREYMGYGPAIPPLTGLSATTGWPDSGPQEVGLSMPDPTAGITAAWAIVSALAKRDVTGVGDHLDVTLWESTGVLAAEAWMQYELTGTQPSRRGNRSPHMSPHGVFRCSGDDAWISIACRDEHQWGWLADLIDLELRADARFANLAARRAHEAELEAIINAWTADQDRWALTDTLQALGIPSYPSLTAADIVGSEHLNGRGLIERLEHPEVGTQAHVGIPWRLSVRGGGVRSAAPCLGADTDAFLTELGYTRGKIADLRSRGVLG